MIVTCPACDTRFLVEDSALGRDSGRRMRCASCGNVWLYSPEAAAIHAAVAEVAAETMVAPLARTPNMPLPPANLRLATAAPSQVQLQTEAQRTGLRAEPEARPADAPLQPRMSGLPTAGEERKYRVQRLAFLLLVALIILVLVRAREQIMAFWPPSAIMYAMVGLGPSPTAGLEVTVSPSRTATTLVIDGDIVNRASLVRQVPQLRITLRDTAKEEIDSRVITGPVDQLLPGARAHFTTVFDNPNDRATDVDVSFVSP